MASVFKRENSPNWYAEWFDHVGKRITRSTRTTDKRSAERIAGKWEADAALRRANVIDPRLEQLAQQGERSIKDHLQDFRAALDSANRTVKHIDHVIGVVQKIAKSAGFVTIRDISVDAVNRYASDLRRTKSTRTVQSHLGALKQFTNWLTRTHKLPFDPLSSVRKPNPNSDRKRERRMVLPSEWLWLKSTTEGSPRRFQMAGIERAALYDLAIQTGLRAAELRSLRRSSFQLDAEQPYVICYAKSTKNRKTCRQFIQPELARTLKHLFSDKSPGEAAFSLPTKWRMAAMMRKDTETARKAYVEAAKDNPNEFERRQNDQFLLLKTEDGELDFHSLRHSCGAWLAQTGAHPKAIQSIMRHSSITLTMDQYGHLFPDEQARVIERLGTLFKALDPAKLPNHLQYGLQQSQHDSVRSDATVCERLGSNGDVTDDQNTLRIANLCDSVQPASLQCGNTPGRIRTSDRRIRNPLLYPAELRARP
jgi:integrase